MEKSGRDIRSCTHRIFLLAVVLSLLVSGMGVLPGVGIHRATAQDNGWDIGEPPTYSDISVASLGDTGSVDVAATVAVDPGTRAASLAFFQSNYLTSLPPVGWTGSFASCTPGTTSAAYRQAVLNQIAYFRAMAGIPADISLSETYNAKAQQAALMMGAAQSLSHFPGPGWPCYTADGAEAARNSNLGFRASSGGSPAAYDPVVAYIKDSGGNNAAVGHRRWLLYPQTQTFGTGDVHGGPWNGWDVTTANAIWVFDGRHGDPRPATRDGFVAWPPPGYVPYQVTYPRWSFSYPGADFSGATVSIVRAGDPVSLSVESATANGFGENTIVWLMEGLGNSALWPKPTSDARYSVTVGNVLINGAPQTFTYDVTVFDPADDGRPDPAVTLNKTRTTVNSWVSYSIVGYPANSTVQITWRRLTGSTINIGTVQTDASGSATGRFRVPATPGGPNQQITFASGGTSTSVLFEVAPRIKVNTSPGIRGQQVDVSLRGYSRQESVRIRWRNPATGQFVELARVTTSNTGSANVMVTVPSWAPDGKNSVRGDGTVFRQQTNAVLISGGPFQPASAATPSPTATATPTETVTATVTVTPEETPTATETASPPPIETATATETPAETATAAATATADPTETAPAEPTIPADEPATGTGEEGTEP